MVLAIRYVNMGFVCLYSNPLTYAAKSTISSISSTTHISLLRDGGSLFSQFLERRRIAGESNRIITSRIIATGATKTQKNDTLSRHVCLDTLNSEIVNPPNSIVYGWVIV